MTDALASLSESFCTGQLLRRQNPVPCNDDHQTRPHTHTNPNKTNPGSLIGEVKRGFLFLPTLHITFANCESRSKCWVSERMPVVCTYTTLLVLQPRFDVGWSKPSGGPDFPSLAAASLVQCRSLILNYHISQGNRYCSFHTIVPIRGSGVRQTTWARSNKFHSAGLNVLPVLVNEGHFASSHNQRYNAYPYIRMYVLSILPWVTGSNDGAAACGSFPPFRSSRHSPPKGWLEDAMSLMPPSDLHIYT